MENASVDLSVSPARIGFPARYNAVSDFIDRHLAGPQAARTAFVDDTGSCTYAELGARVARAAGALRALGAGVGERVLLCLPDGIDFVAAFWGALRAGVVPVPVNTRLAAPDYAFLLRDSAARALLTTAALLPRFAPAGEGPGPAVTTAICGDAPEGARSFDALMAGSSPLARPVATRPEDIAFWLYSSGTTAAPKGVMHRHRNLLPTAVHFAGEVLGIGPQDRLYSASKMFFAYGLGNSMTFALHAGATGLLSAGHPSAERMLATLRESQPSVFFAVPALFAQLLEEAGAQAVGEAADSLRLCVSAGEPLPPGLARRWEAASGVAVVDGIGSTEMLQTFLSNRPAARRPGATGWPVPGYAARIVDGEGRDLPAGAEGELVVRGPSAAAGYWNRPERSARTFAGGWVHTGDRFRVDGEGYFHCVGRNDDLMKVNGQWVSPYEVEAVLLEHPAVLEAAVVAGVDARGLAHPRAFVVLRAGERPGAALAAALRAYAGSRLARSKIPDRVRFLDALPRTATGKVQRYKLREAGRRAAEGR